MYTVYRNRAPTLRKGPMVQSFCVLPSAATELLDRTCSQPALEASLNLQFVVCFCSIALFIWGWLRTATFATFHFLVKQPGELFNLSWPSPGETVSTALLM